MTKRDYNKLYDKIKAGDKLLIPLDSNTPNNRNIPNPYKAVVLGSYGGTITTQLIDEYKYQDPLTWNENYNFKGAKKI